MVRLESVLVFNKFNGYYGSDGRESNFWIILLNGQAAELGCNEKIQNVT